MKIRRHKIKQILLGGYKIANYYYLASAIAAVYFSQLTTPSASWSLVRPPLNLISRQESTMWPTVCCCRSRRDQILRGPICAGWHDIMGGCTIRTSNNLNIISPDFGVKQLLVIISTLLNKNCTNLPVTDWCRCTEVVFDIIISQFPVDRTRTFRLITSRIVALIFLKSIS